MNACPIRSAHRSCSICGCDTSHAACNDPVTRAVTVQCATMFIATSLCRDRGNGGELRASTHDLRHERDDTTDRWYYVCSQSIALAAPRLIWTKQQIRCELAQALLDGSWSKQACLVPFVLSCDKVWLQCRRHDRVTLSWGMLKPPNSQPSNFLSFLYGLVPRTRVSAPDDHGKIFRSIDHFAKRASGQSPMLLLQLG